MKNREILNEFRLACKPKLSINIQELSLYFKRLTGEMNVPG